MRIETTDLTQPMVGADIVLAQPRGFCAGVDRAIEIVERALQRHGAPIYVRHEIVHNKYVVDDLRAKGAVFVNELEEIPAGAIVIFSAHGVSQTIQVEAKKRNLQIFDATCPLVTKVHVEVAKMRKSDLEVVMIGHKGHPEVEGTLGQSSDGMYLVETVADVAKLVVADPSKLAFVTQTTLSVDDAAAVADALRTRFPSIQEPKKSDICYATQNRQDAVKLLTKQCDLVIVVGSANSSNSNRLREVAERLGVPAYLINGPESLEPQWLVGKQHIGVTAGASAPEVLVKRVIEQLKILGAVSVRTMDGLVENVSFPLPKGLPRQDGDETKKQ
uniref:4-hydroxy-3-methylbut-2-enyl diphosphate reductase n=1 Tax=Orrella sp. TaxID=1921583 RepID=UPI0040474821